MKNPEAASRDSGPATLGQRLNRLFDVVHPADRGPFSNMEVAARLGESGGETVSATYLWQLRTGKRDNPTKRHLEALARFFGVPVAYFFDDDAAARIDQELATLRKMRDVRVEHIAMRTVGLSDRSMDAVVAMIDRVRELEGLPADPE
ncbi:helix-turn-helix domain-containing protein [Streptomyces sp. NPDC057654]|uniref:helix-turn-helix domain-containing protein n=1 Tax=Streptomyces sp. NPDC057654 TaxID=3346196 RepID=UPI00368BA3E4